MGLYLENKKAKTGTQIECPICHLKFIKKQYSQSFCSLKCKDDFWNRKGDRHTYKDHIEKPYDGADNDQFEDEDLGIHN
jgi:hypothetical protein